MTLRSILTRLALAVCLGLATTIAVAWLVVLLVDPVDGSHPYFIAVRERDPARQEGSGILTCIRMPAFATCALQTAAAPILAGRYASSQSPEDLIPTWARPAALPWIYDTTPWPPSRIGVTIAVVGRGWPLVALWHETDSAGAAAPPRGGFALPGWNNRSRYGHALPYRPVWIGLLTDTALFGGLWVLVLLGGARLRRTFRLRRHHCPHCNYDLRATPPGSPCPECGRTRR